MTFKLDPLTQQEIADAQVFSRDGGGNPVAADPTHGLPVTAGYAGVDSASSYNSVTTPAAAAVVASLAIAVAGVYEVFVYPRYSGTVGAAELDNLNVYSGAGVVGRIPMDAAVGGPGSPYRLPRVTVAAASAINVVTVGLATTGAVYRAEIVATRVV